MIPVAITLRRDDQLSGTSGSGDLKKAADELGNELKANGSGDDFEVLEEAVEQLYVFTTTLEKQFVPTFLSVLRDFMRIHKDILLELRFDQNRITLDPLSIYRAEKEMNRLTEGSVSISGNNIVIGGDNIGSDFWPRKR